MPKCPEGIENCYCLTQTQPVTNWASSNSDFQNKDGNSVLNNPFTDFHGVKMELKSERKKEQKKL